MRADVSHAAAGGVGVTTTGSVVTPKLQIDWGGGFTDETANMLSARGEYKLTAPGSAVMSPRGIVNSMTLTLLNARTPSQGGGIRHSTRRGHCTPTCGRRRLSPACQFDVKIDAAHGCGCLRA